MKSYVDDKLSTMRNNKGRKKPKDVYQEEHKKLSEEVKDAAKGIADYGMLVAALVATVAFPTALTVFILTNAVALFTSSASLLSFSSNFTSSRLAKNDRKFVKSLHPSLTFGRALLIISFALCLSLDI